MIRRTELEHTIPFMYCWIVVVRTILYTYRMFTDDSNSKIFEIYKTASCSTQFTMFQPSSGQKVSKSLQKF